MVKQFWYGGKFPDSRGSREGTAFHTGGVETLNRNNKSLCGSGKERPVTECGSTKI